MMTGEALYPNCIVHYSRSLPFRSITNHPREDWQKVVASLTASNSWGLERFSDPFYLTRRLEVESSIRREFIALGGQPELIHPIYCFLGRHHGWEEHKLNVGYSVDLKDVPPNTLSFTYGDSLLAFNEVYRAASGEKYKNSLCNKVFLLEDLETLFKSPEYPKENPLTIEVQLWTVPSKENVKIIDR